MAIEGQTPVQDYDALSYRWGKVHTDQFVWLEGVPVQVSDNLYAALFNLRKSGPGRVRTIWVDQLCINQGDDTEKSRIIPKQHVIYKQADRVIV
jgi:Heterokaryon incompatibility protein (HET)